MNLPPPDAALSELIAFTLRFDGYAWGGGGPLELSYKLEAVTGPDDWFMDTATDPFVIRAVMFAEQRGVRWCDPDDPDARRRLEEFLRFGVERLRVLGAIGDFQREDGSNPTVRA